MDRTLDDIISERPRDSGRREPPRAPRDPPREPRDSRRPPPPRAPRREEYPRDGVRKTRRDDRTNIDTDWVHDRYEDDRYERERSYRRQPEEQERHARPARSEEAGTKLKVDNIHYELTESDLRELFERIGPVVSVRLLYDRMDRSEGTAFVTYSDPRDAKDAITDFNGCNANGQPIRITLLPTAPAAAAASKGSLFDRVERPSRSLFDRIEGGPSSRDDSRDRDDSRRRRNRSDSPRSRRPATEFVDRYVPGGRRSRSPIKPREPGRRPGQRREDSGRDSGRRGRTDDEGRPMVGGRPRKTAEELDAEMADYWGKSGDEPKANGADATNGASKAAAANLDDDIDMIE